MTFRHATTFPRVDFLVVDVAVHDFINTAGMPSRLRYKGDRRF
jgi:hypothetical protein